VLMHGYANMPDGRGMSKSEGVLIDPHEVIEKHGRDPMRLFLLSVTAQGDDMNFSWEETAEMQRRLNILWNVFRFPLAYMRADGFSPEETTVEAVAEDLELVDEWVLSRLQTVSGVMTEAFDAFEHHKGLDALLSFVVEDVSRFYVQEVRERMWDEADSASKRAAYATLYRVLVDVVALLAPYAPFLAEEIYGSLTGETGHPTVHMCDYPDGEQRWENEVLEKDIEIIREIEQSGSAARQQAGRQLRWPVARVVVSAGCDRIVDAVERRSDVLKDRLNAKEIEIYGEGEQWPELQYAAEADMSELGPAFGDDADRIMHALNEAAVEHPTVEEFEAAVEEATGLDVSLRDSMISEEETLPNNVEKMGFIIEHDAGTDEGSAGTVYVDTTLTEDIESEGYAREVIRRVQSMRKDLDLDLEARIRVDLDIADERVADLVAEHEALIKEEVRADAFGTVEDGHRKTWEVEGVEMDIAIIPVTEVEV